MLEVKKRDEMFATIMEMSDRQVDPIVKNRLKSFLNRSNEDIKDELLGLIDDIVCCSWTSDFEISILNIIWMNIGGSKTELLKRNKQLPLKMKEWQDKYKWQVAHFNVEI